MGDNGKTLDGANNTIALKISVTNNGQTATVNASVELPVGDPDPSGIVPSVTTDAQGHSEITYDYKTTDLPGSTVTGGVMYNLTPATIRIPTPNKIAVCFSGKNKKAHSSVNGIRGDVPEA